jgi:mannose-1-phosphate guanylyltransferase/mannose-6-phosphate isomerase
MDAFLIETVCGVFGWNHACGRQEVEVIKMTTITPVILAGGSGTRLWPLSRKSYPKQFSNLIGSNTLFQQCALRLSSSDQVTFAKHITVTNSDFRFITVEQLQKVSIDPGPILIEPESKNTAPAILAATLYAYANDADAVLLVAPSDHVIPDTAAFHAAVCLGLKEVLDGKILTFGISPTRPETGYGYLSLANAAEHQPVAVKKFVEKPDEATAKLMIQERTYLWNAGIFMFRAKDLIQAFKDIAPKFIAPLEKSITDGKFDLGFFRFDPSAWSKCESLSIDYAIMEHAPNLVAIPFSAGWSDLGGWDAVWKEMGPNQDGVVVSENAHAIECKDTLLRSESTDQELIGIGLENIIAIAMPDAVLVAHKNKAQDVKQVVSKLKLNNVKQAEVFPKDHRPWGWYESLTIRDRFQVKRILVNPGAALSLQSHKYRSEHWIVVQGNAKVTVDDKVKNLNEGQSVYIPLGAIHRLENLGKISMVLIEVQTGSYFGEDDIVRYEDLYKRE